MSTLSIAPAFDVHVPAQRRPVARRLAAVPSFPGAGLDAAVPTTPVVEVTVAPVAGTVRRPAARADRTAAHGQVRPATARVRLTRRGRLVAVLTFLGLALAAMTVLGGWATATGDSGVTEPVRVVEVAPGDTLYGIAGEIAEPGEVRAMVHRIQELNSLPGAQIVEGQKLAVPRG